MALLVVDSSVVIKWFVPEIYSTEAHLILSAYQKGDLDLLAPDLLNAEIGNIVWKKQTFQGLASSDAEQVIETFRALTFSFTPTSELLNDAYGLAVKYQRSVYDMLYVALSLRQKCSFVTADERLVNAVQSALSNVVWVKNWV